MIQEPQATRSPYGDEAIHWATVLTRWASIEPLRGGEFIEAKVQQAQVDTRIRLRYAPEARPQMRVMWKSQQYVIDSVIDVWERDRETHLMCRLLVEP